MQRVAPLDTEAFLKLGSEAETEHGEAKDKIVGQYPRTVDETIIKKLLKAGQVARDLKKW